MLLMLIEQEYKLDEVIFCDLGKEFKAIYNIRDKAKKILEEKNIKYTELNLAEKFNNLMLEKDVKKRNGTTQKGYGICGGLCRYGTTLKEKEMSKYLKEQYGENYREYIRNSSRRNKENTKRKKWA